MVMLRVLGEDKEARAQSWLADLWFDFRKRVINLLASAFKSYDCKFALNLLTNNIYKKTTEGNYERLAVLTWSQSSTLISYN